MRCQDAEGGGVPRVKGRKDRLREDDPKGVPKRGVGGIESVTAKLAKKGMRNWRGGRELKKGGDHSKD